MLKSPIKAEIHKIWKLTQGDSQICVAVLDGLVDQSHSCFNAANLTRMPTLVQGEATSESMCNHGTHVASIIFGQPAEMLNVVTKLYIVRYSSPIKGENVNIS